MKGFLERNGATFMKFFHTILTYLHRLKLTLMIASMPCLFLLSFSLYAYQGESAMLEPVQKPQYQKKGNLENELKHLIDEFRKVNSAFIEETEGTEKKIIIKIYEDSEAKHINHIQDKVISSLLNFMLVSGSDYSINISISKSLKLRYTF